MTENPRLQIVQSATPSEATASQDREPPVSSIIGGKYRTIRCIGQGGMGVVYEVQHIHTLERLALKILRCLPQTSAETVARFRREARASAQIKSEHVVRVFDADIASEHGGASFLVMELLKGKDLQQLAADKPQAPENVVRWLRQAACGLDRAHQLGIVHRDLKPSNLFLAQQDGREPVLKILDFGIAKILGDASGCTTASGELLGTPIYMAPEQMKADQRLVTFATDLYALGLIAYWLLFASSYRRSSSVVQLVAEVLHEPMAVPSAVGSHLGPAFDAWFLKSCHSDPTARFESASVQIDSLAQALLASSPTLRLAPDRDRLSFPENASTIAAGIATTGAGTSRNYASAPEATVRKNNWGARALALSLFLAALGGSVAIAQSLRGTNSEVQEAMGVDGPAAEIPSACANASAAVTHGDKTEIGSTAERVLTPSVQASAAASAKPRASGRADGSVETRPSRPVRSHVSSTGLGSAIAPRNPLEEQK